MQPSDPGQPDLVEFYRERIRRHGYSYEAMWGDPSAWKSQVRFEPLAFLPVKPDATIVDIGCGTADLAPVLAQLWPGVKYVGVEMVPEFAAEARARHGIEVIEMDAFRNPGQLPEADWYVSLGTLNKQWCISSLNGVSDEEKIFGFLDQLYDKSRAGVAVSLTTSVVDYRKEGVCNIDPGLVATRMARLTPHFLIYHGYPLFEFFTAAWRGIRRGAR